MHQDVVGFGVAEELVGVAGLVVDVVVAHAAEGHLPGATAGDALRHTAIDVSVLTIRRAGHSGAREGEANRHHHQSSLQAIHRVLLVPQS